MAVLCVNGNVFSYIGNVLRKFIYDGLLISILYVF